jgi:hypothetical protein
VERKETIVLRNGSVIGCQVRIGYMTGPSFDGGDELSDSVRVFEIKRTPYVDSEGDGGEFAMGTGGNVMCCFGGSVKPLKLIGDGEGEADPSLGGVLG